MLIFRTTPVTSSAHNSKHIRERKFKLLGNQVMNSAINEYFLGNISYNVNVYPLCDNNSQITDYSLSFFCHVLSKILLKTNMKVLSIVDTQKEDLKFLQDHTDQISADFCKLAWSFLSKGVNMKLYQAASQKLQVDVKQIQSGVESLANIFIEAAKNELDEDDLKETLISLGFSEKCSSIICSEYLSQKYLLEQSLPEAGIQHLQFKDLEWRFETQVASKSLRNQIQPRVILKFDFKKGGGTENICLQSDIPNVVHMNNIISQALQDSRTQHSRRIQRAVT